MKSLQATLDSLRVQVEANPFTESQNLPAELKTAPLSRLESSLPQNTQPKPNKSEIKQTLSNFLSQCMAGMKAYGKTPADLPAMVECFFHVLKDESPEKIVFAFEEYLRRGHGMPEPSDIYSLINPPPPVLSAAMYTAIKKRSAYGEVMYGSELDFIHAFEAQELAKVKS